MRLDYAHIAGVNAVLLAAGLEYSCGVSQINGCSYCVDEHAAT